MTPTRPISVPDHGVFEVSEHISRCDDIRPRAGRSAWHGWQVRWQEGATDMGAPLARSRFFGDRKHGGCAQSLQAAVAYVEKHFSGKRSQANPDAGIRVVQEARKGLNVTRMRDKPRLFRAGKGSADAAGVPKF